jgi:23S rRNA G2445 N2-methylase RlmL
VAEALELLDDARLQPAEALGGEAALAGVRLFGSDVDRESVEAAARNAKVAGLEGRVMLCVGDVAGSASPVKRKTWRPSEKRRFMRYV